jgi:hypothetical protein
VARVVAVVGFYVVVANVPVVAGPVVETVMAGSVRRLRMSNELRITFLRRLGIQGLLLLRRVGLLILQLLRIEAVL